MTAATRKKKPPFRSVLSEIMEPYKGGPEATRISLVVDICVLICIVASIVLIPLEYIYPQHTALIWQIEQGLTAVFVVEYLVRWYAAPNRALYPLTFYAVVDLLAILPSLLLIGAQLFVLRAVRGLRILRLLRLLRLVRLLKLLRYGFLIERGLVSMRIWFDAVVYQYRLRQLGMLFLYVVIAWVVGANLLHFTESRLAGADSPYYQYWNSYWYIVIVLISGIEDKEPLSLLGRIEVTAFLIVGICTVGMLTGEIVSILVRKAQRAGRVAFKPPNERMRHHIVILGDNHHLDPIIRQVSAALKGRHFILVVSPNAEKLPITDKKVYQRVFALAGDPVDSRVLEAANIDDAFRVIVLASHNGDDDPHLIDSRSLMQTLAVVCRDKKMPIVTELLCGESLRYADNLRGPEFMVMRRYGGRFMVQAVLNPDVTKIYDRLMTFTEESNEFYTVRVPKKLVGSTFQQAQLFFLDNDDEALIPVGIDRSPPGLPSTRFWLNPSAQQSGLSAQEMVLSKDDRLIFIGFERPSFAKLQREEMWQGEVLIR